MGGIGSGRRRHYGAKRTTENFLALDIRKIAREGSLTPGNRFGWMWLVNDKTRGTIEIEAKSPDAVRLIYRYESHGGDWQDYNYQVRLDRTSCHLGGERVWFLCPALGCGKRVAILYGGAIFACRHCYNLAYQSQNEDRLDRAARRHEKLRARLGWPGGIFDPSLVWMKPRGMHWCTFSRLAREAESTQAQVVSLTVQRFGFGLADTGMFKDLA